jgi:hypothetical protein
MEDSRLERSPETIVHREYVVQKLWKEIHSRSSIHHPRRRRRRRRRRRILSNQ